MENEKLLRLSDVLAAATTPEKCDGYNLYPPSHGELLERISNIPAADAVEVRRCRECLYRSNSFTGCPKLHGLETPDDFFCKYGKPKEET